MNTNSLKKSKIAGTIAAAMVPAHMCAGTIAAAMVPVISDFFQVFFAHALRPQITRILIKMAM